MEIPAYICFFAPVAVAVLVVWLSRYLSDRNTDDAVKTKLDDAERLSEESGIEAYRIRETARESKTTVDRIRERESEAGKSVELAESAVREAHKDNRRAEQIIEESLAILESAEKKK